MFKYEGSNVYCLDKNFAGTLIIWDRMFGTFAEERDDVDIVYGLVDQVKSFNPFYIQVWNKIKQTIACFSTYSLAVV